MCKPQKVVLKSVIFYNKSNLKVQKQLICKCAYQLLLSMLGRPADCSEQTC